MTKQLSFFLDVLPRHTNIMKDKDSIFLMNVLPDVYICPLRKKSAPPLPEGTVNVHIWQYSKFTEDFI